jgi:hypothetical protein
MVSETQLTRSERLSLDTEVDGDSVFFLSLLEDGDHDFWPVVDSEDDIFDAGL